MRYLLLAALLAILGSVAGSLPRTVGAELGVTGQTTAFKNMVNSLLQGATVDIVGGKMTMTGTPTNEFGRQLKEVIDSPHKVTIEAVKNGDGVMGGAYRGGGKQTIDLDDMAKLKAPGSGLPTKAAWIIHEVKEVFNSVKDGKTKPIEQDGGRDFRSNHEGSGKAAESAVANEESGITREPGRDRTSREREQPDGSFKYKIKMRYKKGADTILVDVFITRRGNKYQVDDVKLEPVPPRRGRLFITQKEPGMRVLTTDLDELAFVPFDDPGYLEIDPSGNLYISEETLDKVVVLDSDLRPKFEITSPFLDNPQGVAVSAGSERIFVAVADQVLVFDLDGAFLSAFSHPQLDSARGLEVDAGGFLYASSFGNDLVLKFDGLSGALVAAIGDPLLDGPEGIAIDQFGNVWVSSFLNDRILEFAPDGQFVGELAVGGDLDGPTGLALTPQSFLEPGLEPGAVVADFPETLLASSFNNNLVLEFDLDSGSLIRKIAAKSATGIGQLETLEEGVGGVTELLVGGSGSAASTAGASGPSVPYAALAGGAAAALVAVTAAAWYARRRWLR